MKASNLKFVTAIISLFFACFAGQLYAQVPVRTGPAPIAEIKKARAAVDANPHSLDAFKEYVYALGISSPNVATEFKALMAKDPQNVIIPLAFGTVYYNAEMPQAKDYLLKANALDSQNANAWFMLSVDAGRWGHNDLSVKYLKMAVFAEPSNEQYAFNYLSTFANANIDVYKQKTLEFIKRFPTSEYGAVALYQLADRITDVTEKVTYLEKLRNLYPPNKYSSSLSGMNILADLYLETDPSKALELVNTLDTEKDWKLRKDIAESLIKINKLQQSQKYQDAIFELEHLKLPKYNFIKEFIDLKKAALQDQAGNPEMAFDSLSTEFAKLPTDRLYSALKMYGNKAGKSEAQIATHIDTLRRSNAKAAYPFTLGLYDSQDSLKLSSLKGKVVLLTFWFPGCNPCREEFPHFQAVINKFKKEDVVYLGINVTPLQDAYVLPFLKNNKYSFIPLRGSSAFAMTKFGVEGEPQNFLIDKQGKISYSDFRINSANHRTLELMISSLLQNNQP